MMLEFKYRMLQVVRTGGNIFWSLAFPIMLATLYHFAFGSLGTPTFTEIPVAVVEQKENKGFSELLTALDGELLNVRYMDESTAFKALDSGEVCGIYYVSDDVKLSVGGTGLDQTVLSSVADSYQRYAAAIEDITSDTLSGGDTGDAAYAAVMSRIQAYLDALSDDTDHISNVSLGGKTYNNMLEYFFALIAMACFYGSFTGQMLGEQNAANVSQLAARRIISPSGRMKLAFIDLAVGFLIQFVCVVMLLLYMQFALGLDFSEHFFGMVMISGIGSLLGVSFGIMVGATGHLKGVGKTVLTVVVPLVLCFLSGLMIGDMKSLIEKTCPIINRLNPAALISDAFYYLNIYEETSGITLRLAILAVYAFVMTLIAVVMMRRNKYDSI